MKFNIKSLKIFIFLFLCLTVWNSQIFAKSLPPGTGQADVKANILIMLDVSGSMSAGVPFTPINISGPNDSDVDSNGNVHTINWDGGFISVHNFLGTPVTTYGTGGSSGYRASKIAIDHNDNVYGKNTDTLVKWSKTGVNTWTEDWAVNISSNGCGDGDDDSDIEIYHVTNEIYITDRQTNKTCIYNSGGTFVGSRATSPTHNYPYAIDSINGVAYHYTSDSKIKVDFIDTARTPVSGTTESVYLGDIIGPPDFVYWSRVNDIEVDKRGDIYIADRTGGKVHKFSAWNTPGGGLEHIGTYTCSGLGSSGLLGVYGFGIDHVHDVFWGADYEGGQIVKAKIGPGNTWECTSAIGSPTTKSRMQVATDVIKVLMQDSSLTDGANFGLLNWSWSDNQLQNWPSWDHSPYFLNGPYPVNKHNLLKAPISPTGAQEILNAIPTTLTQGYFPTSASAGFCTFICAGGTYIDDALNDAKDYFNGNFANFPSPMDPSASCQNNYIIVISDGIFNGTDPSATTLQLYDDLGIKTYMVGFGLTDDPETSADELAEAQANWAKIATNGQTETVLYADDEVSLINVLRDAIRQAVSLPLTFSSPQILPDINLGDSIYQSVFEFENKKQWKGHLKRFQMDNEGNIIEPQEWDAGEKLNDIRHYQRKMWSVYPNMPSNDINNFITTNIGAFKGEMYLNDSIPLLHGIGTEPYNIVEFTRGGDAFDYDNDGDIAEDRNWKLADIFHSQPALVATPPDAISVTPSKSDDYYRHLKNYQGFKTAQAGRTPIILAGSNAGMLHAFHVTTGEEKWSFIPPSMLSKLRNVVSANANQTNAIYGVDGSPLVKDIYYDGSWKTVVMVGLGKGGNAYSALDITDTENPSHLFSFMNDPVRQKAYYWSANGFKTEHDYSGGSIDSNYDYRKLGEAWSTPRIIRMKIGGNDKWVGIFGAGFNNNVTSAVGSSIFIIDMEDGGKTIEVIDVADNNDPDSDPATNFIINSVPSSLVPIVAEKTTLANYNGALVYFADYEGKLWKLNLTDEGTLYEMQSLFDAKATKENERKVMFEVSASIDESTNKLWLYYGTGDQQQLASTSSQIQNQIYGIKDTNFPNYDTSAPTLTEVDCFNTTNQTSCIAAAGMNGWFANLDSKEKVTAKASVKSGIVYFNRYVPDGTNPCQPGAAFQSTHDYRYGCTQTVSSDTGDDKISLGKGVATAITFYKGKQYIGLSGASSNDDSVDSSFTLTGNILTGSQIGSANASPFMPVIKWWRELF